jgi:CO dehydrogenase maturation factor
VDADAFPLAGKRIGILGKGGAGKSTVTVLLARELARRGYKVCLLDADSTNVGLHRALGSEEAPAPLIEYFGGMVFSGGLVTCPVDDPTPLPAAQISLEDLPSPYLTTPMNGICLLSGGKLGDMGPGGGCDGPIAKIARDLVVSSLDGEMVMLVDLKAGMEDSARGVLTNLDLAIVVVDPTVASVRIAADLREMVRQIRDGVPPATRHLEDPALARLAIRLFREARVKDVLAILNRVPDTNTEVRLAGKVFEAAGLKPIGTLREDPTIGFAWLEGSRVLSHENQGRVRTIVDRIEDACSAETLVSTL